MATVTKPIALNESFNTTDSTPVNIADVLKSGLAGIAGAISPNASDIPYDNTTSGLTADDVQEAIDELATEKANSSTTLAGYGITNAYTKTETDAEIDAEIANIGTFSASGTSFALTPTSEGNVLAHSIYGMSIQDGTPTPSSPVDIESSVANWKCVGKNLIPYPYGTIQSSIFSVESDGTIVMNGSTSNRINCWLVDHTGGDFWLPSGTYKIITSETPDNVKWSVGINYYMDNTWVSAVSVATGKKSATFTVDTSSSAYNIVSLCISALSNSSFSNLTIKIMVVQESVTDDTYEPYHSTDITTDLTLRAIEVSSTDDYNLEKDGHYYISDTVDWGEDDGYVLTRRVAYLPMEVTNISGTTVVINIDATLFRKSPSYIKYGLCSCGTVRSDVAYWTMSDANTNLAVGELCARGSGTSSDQFYFKTAVSTIEEAEALISGQYVASILATPTTTPLTAQQAEALLSLKTYDTSTSITCTADVSPTMKIEYAKERVPALALSGHNESRINALKIADLNTALIELGGN